jgi:hypothetical protein
MMQPGPSRVNRGRRTIATSCVVFGDKLASEVEGFISVLLPRCLSVRKVVSIGGISALRYYLHMSVSLPPHCCPPISRDPMQQ